MIVSNYARETGSASIVLLAKDIAMNLGVMRDVCSIYWSGGCGRSSRKLLVIFYAIGTRTLYNRNEDSM